MTDRASPTSRRTAPAAAVLMAMAIAVASVAASCTSETNEARGGRLVPEVSSPEIEQARWVIKARGSGALGKVTRADKKRLHQQRPRLASLVRDVYDSLFLYPSRRRAVLHKRFSQRAARTVVTSRAGVPGDAERVKTASRRARISIQVDGARRAAAVVLVRARGRLQSKVFRIVHRATLWLERPKRLWRVIGFEVSQEPAKSHEKAKKDTRKEASGKKKKNQKPSKKRRRDRANGNDR